MQQGTWPSGTLDDSEGEPQGGVMQILNIVVPESVILASRERCPYLVRLEVVETGLDGSDARLYAAGAPRIGLTVEEALNIASTTGGAENIRREGHQPCEIPPELVDDGLDYPTESFNKTLPSGPRVPPRGGWQIEAGSADFIDAENYETVREHEYEQLHQHMQNVQNTPRQSPQPIHADR